jgi:hypothetical protein
MPARPPKLPALGFAGFEDSPAAGGGRRRRSRWSIRPTEEPGERLAADAARFVDQAALYAGLGRRPEK